jgi:hypothetical protein
MSQKTDEVLFKIYGRVRATETQKLTWLDKPVYINFRRNQVHTVMGILHMGKTPKLPYMSAGTASRLFLVPPAPCINIRVNTIFIPKTKSSN